MSITAADESHVALIQLKVQYGQTVVVPACEISREFALIAGTKLLTPQTIDAMKRLGYIIKVEQTLPQTL